MGGGIGKLSRILDTIEVFDPAVSAWSFAAPTPEPRTGAAAAGVAGKACLFGGEDRIQTYGDVFVYVLGPPRGQ